MKTRPSNTVLILPIVGICLFILLYFIAAILYPGGSEVDRHSKGFSWMHNYWCDLLETHAENGEPNKAKPAAIIAMCVLCLSIILFWYFIPRLFTLQSYWKKLIQYPGMLSMGILVLLRADYHDIIINAAVLLGLIAMAITLTGLFKISLYKLFILGILCLLLCLLNNYIYYTKNWIGWLAIIQKISFFLFLLWFTLLTMQLLKKNHTVASSDHR